MTREGSWLGGIMSKEGVGKGRGHGIRVAPNMYVYQVRIVGQRVEPNGDIGQQVSAFTPRNFLHDHSPAKCTLNVVLYSASKYIYNGTAYGITPKSLCTCAYPQKAARWRALLASTVSTAHTRPTECNQRRGRRSHRSSETLRFTRSPSGTRRAGACLNICP